MDIEKLREEALTKEIGMRSCWNCNGAHHHLKDAEYVISCLWCSKFYYKGVDITIYDENPQS